VRLPLDAISSRTKHFIDCFESVRFTPAEQDKAFERWLSATASPRPSRSRVKQSYQGGEQEAARQPFSSASN